MLVDIDDTIEDLLVAWCGFLNGTYKTNVNYEDITEWDMQKFFPALTKEQIYKPLQTRKFWETVKPKPYAQQYLKALCDCGFDVYLCTSSDYRSIKIKYETVIMKYFPYIPWEKIIITSRKQMIKADFLIDDAVHNLEGGSYKKILMTAPHNKNYNAKENGMYRVNDWREIYSLLTDDQKQ